MGESPGLSLFVSVNHIHIAKYLIKRYTCQISRRQV